MVQDFIGALSAFMREHEAWAAPFAFLVAFGESLCFASIIWPGWAILVGFSGALAAAGVAPSVLTPMVIASALGGAAGYWVSYWIGLYFKDSIGNVWPFTAHPDLIPRGEAFFKRYGAWSVFLGHFVGPVRAVIPVIAGMFRMPQWSFQIANVTSAIIWAAWAVLAPFWSIYYKDAIFSVLQTHELWVGGALFLAAWLNSLPMTLIAVPTLIVFVVLGGVFMLAHAASLPALAAGEITGLTGPLLALAAGTAGAFLGDIVAYFTGRRSDSELHTIWPNSWSPEAGEQAVLFFKRWGLAGVLPAKFHTTLRSFAPLAAGQAGAGFLPFLVVSSVSSLAWAAVLLAPVAAYVLYVA
jgi:membrane protein DedA with SNARE-associated domain